MLHISAALTAGKVCDDGDDNEDVGEGRGSACGVIKAESVYRQIERLVARPQNDFSMAEEDSGRRNVFALTVDILIDRAAGRDDDLP